MATEPAQDPKPAASSSPWLGQKHDSLSVTEKIANIVHTKKTPAVWFLGLLFAFGVMQLLLLGVTVTLVKGVGVWGLNIPVAWGFAIINFVWWIGIGHAGTLISAILLLLKQDWRTSINRFAEAMTLFAVACAGMFPLLHLGRPWIFYWLMPYPNTLGLWPQFRSPLVWDVFAVTTYALVSLLFWLIGLVPDFATMRDRAQSPVLQRVWGVLAMGWRGSARHWQRYEMMYLLLAGLATPLVLSVHTIVSFDFAVSQLPGWHATIFPPYFVAGAIFAGFAMVITLAIPIRAMFGIKDIITDRHLHYCGNIMLATGLMVGYGYACEAFFAWYSAAPYEQFMMSNRQFGPYAWSYWALMLCNILAPQFLWFRKIRTSMLGLFIVAMFVNVGMWLERFVIVVTSLHADFLPSSWDMYAGTRWDWAVYIGTIGFFLSLMFLFARFVPMVSMFEVRDLILKADKAKERLDAHEG